jgi:hypothetical protein
VEWKSKVNGQVVRLTREGVIEALRGVKPAGVKTHSVEVDGVWFPLRQAFAVATGIPRLDVDTPQCRRALSSLGFRCVVRPTTRVNVEADGRPSLKPAPEVIEIMAGEEDVLGIEPIVLEWGWWKWWDDLCGDSRTGEGISVPTCPGVYEVGVYGQEERLYIGRASNLRTRVKDRMVKGHVDHPASRKIAAQEDVSRVIVRWARTDRPAAAEEELHRLHLERFGALPKYTERT